MPLKSFKFEYTVAGERNAPRHRMVQAMGLTAAQKTFREQTAGMIEPEIVDVWQHVAKGSTAVIRKNTITKL